jgi:hypothetical protein
MRLRTVGFKRSSGPAPRRRRLQSGSVAVLVIAAGLVCATEAHGAAASSVPSEAARPNVAEQAPGYVLVGADGGLFTFGSAAFAGSMAGQQLAAPVSAIAESVDGQGYWLAGQDKGVFAFGDAGFQGSGIGWNYPCFGPPESVCSVPSHPSVVDPSPAVGIARSLDGNGYLVAMADGDVYGYGDAPWDDVGNRVPTSLAAPVVGVAFSADDAGYWLAGADGGVFSVGQAPFYGSLGATRLAAPITGMASTPSGNGYWLVGADGGVFAFGGAPFFGSLPGLGVKPVARVVGIASTPDGKGYWLVGADGGVFAFGDATYLGGVAGKRLAAPVVGIAATTGDPLPQCSGLTFTATTDRSSYSEGQPVTITLTYRNRTAEACSANVGSTVAGCSDAFVYQGTGLPGSPEVWDAHAGPDGEGPPCPPGVYEQPMAAGSSVTVAFTWEQVQCLDFNIPPCSQTPVPAGEYFVWGSWGFDYDGSTTSTFEITGS